MPLTLSRSFTPIAPTASIATSIAPSISPKPADWLRDAGHQAFDRSKSIVHLNFDWMRRMIRDVATTAAQIDPSPGDWTANWIALGIRHQVNTSTLSRAVKRQHTLKRQSLAALNASRNGPLSAAPTPAGDDPVPPTMPVDSADVR
jgi:hypothetical protein